MPPELDDVVETMVEQHLDVNDWGTSNPIYSSLASGFVQPTSMTGAMILSVSADTPLSNPRVGGIYNPRAFSQRLLTEINCGEGSYLERVSWPVSAFGRAMAKVARRHVRSNFDCALSL